MDYMFKLEEASLEIFSGTMILSHAAHISNFWFAVFFFVN